MRTEKQGPEVMRAQRLVLMALLAACGTATGHASGQVTVQVGGTRGSARAAATPTPAPAPEPTTTTQAAPPSGSRSRVSTETVTAEEVSGGVDGAQGVSPLSGLTAPAPTSANTVEINSNIEVVPSARNGGIGARPSLTQQRRTTATASSSGIPTELMERYMDYLESHVTRRASFLDRLFPFAVTAPGDETPLTPQAFAPFVIGGADLRPRPIGPMPQFFLGTFDDPTDVTTANIPAVDNPFPNNPAIVFYRFLNAGMLNNAIVTGEEPDAVPQANPLGIVDPNDTSVPPEPLDEDGIATIYNPVTINGVAISPELDLIPPIPQNAQNGFEFIDLTLAAFGGAGVPGFTAIPQSLRPAFFDPDAQALFLHEQTIPFDVGAGVPNVGGFVFGGVTDANIPSAEVQAAIFRALEVIEVTANVVFVERFPTGVIGDGDPTEDPSDPRSAPFFARGNALDPTGPMLGTFGDQPNVPEDDYPWLLFAQSGGFINVPLNSGSLLGRTPIPGDSGVFFASDDVNGDGIPDLRVSQATGTTSFAFVSAGSAPAIPGGGVPTSIAIANADGDPLPSGGSFGLDLIVQASGLTVFPNSGFGVFLGPEITPPLSPTATPIAAGVIDGAPEAIAGVVGVSGTGLSVLIPNYSPPDILTPGLNTFVGLISPPLDTDALGAPLGAAPVLGGPAADLVLADINGDGFSDVVTANTSDVNGFSVVYNDGQPPQLVVTGGVFGAAEVNEFNPYDQPTLPIADETAINTGDVDPATVGLQIVEAADFNGDGNVDIAGIAEGGSILVVAFNDGTAAGGLFSPANITEFDVAALFSGATVVDLLVSPQIGSALPEVLLLDSSVPGGRLITLANTSVAGTLAFTASAVTSVATNLNGPLGTPLGVSPAFMTLGNFVPPATPELLVGYDDTALIGIFPLTAGVPGASFAVLPTRANPTQAVVAELNNDTAFPEIVVADSAGLLLATGTSTTAAFEIVPSVGIPPGIPSGNVVGTPGGVGSTLPGLDPGTTQIIGLGADFGAFDSAGGTLIDFDGDGLPDTRDDFGYIPAATFDPGATLFGLPAGDVVVNPVGDGFFDDGNDLNSFDIVVLAPDGVDPDGAPDPTVLTIARNANSGLVMVPGVDPDGTGPLTAPMVVRIARRGDSMDDVLPVGFDLAAVAPAPVILAPGIIDATNLDDPAFDAVSGLFLNPRAFTNDAVDLPTQDTNGDGFIDRTRNPAAAPGFEFDLGDGVVDLVETTDRLPDPSFLTFGLNAAVRDRPNPIASVFVFDDGNLERGALVQTLQALGFFFEQQRPGRDSSISVLLENILLTEREDYTELFEFNPLISSALVGTIASELGIPNSAAELLPTPIDFQSIMLEGPFVDSNGRGPTWVPQPQFFGAVSAEIGVVADLSTGDATALQAQYGPGLDEFGNPLSALFIWFYGRDQQCPADVNLDGFQTAADITAYRALFEAQLPVADIGTIDPATGLEVVPLDNDGVINLNDITNFIAGLTATGFGPCIGAGLPSAPATQLEFRNRGFEPGSAGSEPPPLLGTSPPPTTPSTTPTAPVGGSRGGR